MEENKKEKKEYVKPVAEKHASIAVISGSSDDDPCVYASRTIAFTYYH